MLADVLTKCRQKGKGMSAEVAACITARVQLHQEK